MDEATIIETFFRHLGAVRTDVVLGIGDDAALLRPPPGAELALTTDSLLEGVHFLPGSAPRSLGHRALAINLSDLAAVGATPAWALLSLAMPAADAEWLREFATGFGALARAHEVALVGGNLSRGPLAITVQLAGFVPAGGALRRSGAHAGDEIWVSGTLGDAARGRETDDAGGTQPQARALRARFEYPAPRVGLGQALRGIAAACIDISDGLLADLPRLASACGCGAVLELEALPVSEALRSSAGERAWEFALAGGEDYELCFAAPIAQAGAIAALASRSAVPLARCGQLRAASGLELRRGGDVIQFSQSAFGHFGP